MLRGLCILPLLLYFKDEELGGGLLALQFLRLAVVLTFAGKTATKDPSPSLKKRKPFLAPEAPRHVGPYHTRPARRQFLLFLLSTTTVKGAAQHNAALIGGVKIAGWVDSPLCCKN